MSDGKWGHRAGLRGAVYQRLYRAPGIRRIGEPLIAQSIVRRAAPPVLMCGYDDFNQRTVVPRGNFTLDFQLNQAAELLGTVGTFRGQDALGTMIEELHEAFEDLRFEPKSVSWLTDRQVLVVARFRGTGRGSGIQIDHEVAHLWTFEGLRVKCLDVYWERSEALEAAELSE